MAIMTELRLFLKSKLGKAILVGLYAFIEYMGYGPAVNYLLPLVKPLLGL